MPMTCEQCKEPTRSVLLVGTALLCRRCKEDLEGRNNPSSATFRDEIPGGQTFENYGPHPITFYSHSERRAYMAAHGLREREKFAPMPGTDKDPQGIPNPKGYMDPKTLENAAILLSRNGARAEPEEPSNVIPFSGRMSDADAIALQTNTDPARQSRVHRRTDGSH